MMDIFGALKPTLYVSKFIGLGPFAVDEESKALKPSPVAAAYTTGLILAFVGNSVHSLYAKLKSNSSEHTYISRKIDIVLLGNGSLLALSVLAMAIIQKKSIIAMVHGFHDVDTEMAKIGVRFPYREAFRCSCAAIAGIFVLVASLIGCDIFNWYQNDLHFFFTFVVTYFFPIVYSAVMEFQFISGAVLLRKNFAFLNARLARLAEEAPRDGKDTKIDSMMLRNFESHPMSSSVVQPIGSWTDVNFSMFRVRKVSFRDGATNRWETSLTNIKTIRMIHGKLCDVKDHLNFIFSMQLALTVAQAFFIITTNLYLLFTNSIKQMGRSYWMSYPIVWASCRAAELICIILTCTSTCKTANHTAVIVHKLLTENWECSIRNQLKLFSIQLLHRKIYFSACGFFTLDMSLLHSIIASATTYLVILIQFHNSYNN